jgi:hypothetical protein
MDAVAIALVGIGIFLVYEAVKNPNPTPVVTAKTNITAANTGTTS